MRLAAVNSIRVHVAWGSARLWPAPKAEKSASTLAPVEQCRRAYSSIVPPVEQLELLGLRHGVSSDDHLLKKFRRPAFSHCRDRRAAALERLTTKTVMARLSKGLVKLDGIAVDEGPGRLAGIGTFVTG